jgi:hypothetical protein
MQNRVGGSVAERKALIMLATLKNLFRYETGATAIEYGSSKLSAGLSKRRCLSGGSVVMASRLEGLRLPGAMNGGLLRPQPFAFGSLSNLDNGSGCGWVARSVRDGGGDLEFPDGGNPFARQQSGSDAFGQSM